MRNIRVNLCKPGSSNLESIQTNQVAETSINNLEHSSSQINLVDDSDYRTGYGILRICNKTKFIGACVFIFIAIPGILLLLPPIINLFRNEKDILPYPLQACGRFHAYQRSSTPQYTT